MDIKTVGLDFEFYGSNEPKVTPICAALSAGPSSHRTYWLEDGSETKAFIDNLHHLKDQGYTFLAYAAGAESRCFEALGLDPFDFKWVDLYAEFRMLCNSNNDFKYGAYIDKDGKVKFSVPPNVPGSLEYGNSAEDEDNAESPKNLINAVYKLLGIELDIDEKTEMRDLVLSKKHANMRHRSVELRAYCLSDTMYLRALDAAIQEKYIDLGIKYFRDQQLFRGRYVVAMGKCETLGIPLDMRLLDSIVSKTPDILGLGRKSVNALFPADRPLYSDHIPERVKTFKNGKQITIKEVPAKKIMANYYFFVESLGLEDFPRTESGRWSISSETLSTHRHIHPALEALHTHTKTEANLKWFNRDNKEGFFEAVGSDDRIRPYYGTFGTQTGRNAAKAKTFPLAMSSWLRAMVRPPKGQYIVGADFSSQELYVAAKLSGDSVFLDAYDSGDVYLAFGKLSGIIPENGTKKTHSLERNICKAVVLGLQFGLGVSKMALALSAQLQRTVTEDEAKTYVQHHKSTFWKYWAWIREFSQQYKNGKPLSTPDGWVLWTDNEIATSYRNFPVQGTAASITRLAVVLAWERGLKVICPLHDALYILSDNPNKDSEILEQAMIEATAMVLGESIENCTMRIDTKTYSHDEFWVEEKGQATWMRLKPIILGTEESKELVC